MRRRSARNRSCPIRVFHLAVLPTKPHRSFGRLTVLLFRLAHELRQLRDIRRNPPRLIAVFATYASPTIATSFGRYRKPLHQRTVATIGSPTARPTANQSVQLSHRSL